MIDLTKHNCHSCPSLKLAESRGCTSRAAMEYREKHKANLAEAASATTEAPTQVQKIAAQIKAEKDSKAKADSKSAWFVAFKAREAAKQFAKDDAAFKAERQEEAKAKAEKAAAEKQVDAKAARSAQIRAAAILGSKKAAANRAARKAANIAAVKQVIQETEQQAATRREHEEILSGLVAQNMLRDLAPKPVLSCGLDDILAHTLATTPEVAELVTLQVIPAARA